ncbi:MAG: hypothetical protein OEY28_09865 [Nitrospira sp.]|nr:hypothetical protein [Nitrospira sp.]
MPQRESSPRARSRWLCVLVWACLISMGMAGQVDAASATGQKTPSGATAQKKAQTPSPVGHWRETASMATPRSGHTATRLLDGRVLVVGGAHSPTAELFDSVANGGTGAWIDAGSLTQPRGGHTATLLPNGKVLVIGGGFNPDMSVDALALAQVEVFDPAANQGQGVWTKAAPLQIGRSGHTATLLPSGKALVTSGSSVEEEVIDAIELYDPEASAGQGASQIIGTLNPEQDRFSKASLMASLAWPTATLLPSGAVLLVGSDRGQSCNHQAQRVTVSADEQTVEITHVSDELVLCSATATNLPDGRILIVGWADPHLYEDEGTGKPLALLYDDSDGGWEETAVPKVESQHHCATLLPDGTVLVTGGWQHSKFQSKRADLYNPVAADARTIWTSAGNMRSKRAHHTATLLRDGRVLVVGGVSEGEKRLASAEIYDPVGKAQRRVSGAGSSAPLPTLAQ